MNVLVLGVTGMLGSAVFKLFSSDTKFMTWGSLRSPAGLKHFPYASHARLLSGVDVLDQDSLIDVFRRVRPDVVINCVGLVKQLAEAKDPLSALPINSMLPHRLAKLCEISGARLVHISTDCVFSGSRGGYLESDLSDAEDLYGKSKYIGELHDFPHAITLRTSIIGHEVGSNHSLVDWFLCQEDSVKGYTKAVFSGLPTVELARVIRDFIIPKPELNGLYHISAEPVDKCTLLGLVAKVYGKDVIIVPDDKVVVDRSLDSSRFRQVTGYAPAGWPDLIKLMFEQR